MYYSLNDLDFRVCCTRHVSGFFFVVVIVLFECVIASGLFIFSCFLFCLFPFFFFNLTTYLIITFLSGDFILPHVFLKKELYFVSLRTPPSIFGVWTFYLTLYSLRVTCTFANARCFYLSKVDPLGVKGLKTYLP